MKRNGKRYGEDGEGWGGLGRDEERWREARRDVEKSELGRDEWVTFGYSIWIS